MIQRRLYLQIFVGFLLTAIFSVAATRSLISLLGPENDWRQAMLDRVGIVVQKSLPETLGEVETLNMLSAWQEDFGADFWLVDGESILTHHPKKELPVRHMPENNWFIGRDYHGLRIALPDGREFLAGVPGGRHRPLHFFAALAVMLCSVALGCFWLARRLTGRLMRLRGGVEAFAHDIDARVSVEGKDEIADLSAAFNRSADAIAALIESQRVMLASASHEFRAPLSRLRMAIELSKDGKSNDEMMDRAARDIESIDDLVEEMLSVAKMQSHRGDFQTVDLDALVTSVVEGYCIETKGHGGVLWGHSSWIRRALDNLLRNADKHGGGATDVELHREPSYIEIKVKDRGPGLDADEWERIFQPFYRPPGHHESQHGGVGYGLAIVSDVARSHGGSAYCHPREGGGAVFVIRLGLSAV